MNTKLQSFGQLAIPVLPVITTAPSFQWPITQSASAARDPTDSRRLPARRSLVTSQTRCRVASRPVCEPLYDLRDAFLIHLGHSADTWDLHMQESQRGGATRRWPSTCCTIFFHVFAASFPQSYRSADSTSTVTFCSNEGKATNTRCSVSWADSALPKSEQTGIVSGSVCFLQLRVAVESAGNYLSSESCGALPRVCTMPSPSHLSYS